MKIKILEKDWTELKKLYIEATKETWSKGTDDPFNDFIHNLQVYNAMKRFDKKMLEVGEKYGFNPDKITKVTKNRIVQVAK